MSDTVIKVENLSKQYRLGTVGTGTLSHDLNRWWHRLRGKPDPYLKIAQEERLSANKHKNPSSMPYAPCSELLADYVWALKDINLEVKRGEILGIIGRNGAGKSTLLKILSRVTAPTTGEAKVKGRISSLLEVGTGFHPELTGCENIYLNGAINGMTRSEVTSKLDEIVEFSGCVRYIDTPVKRYSSGMTVRLGFAVAAHLEPEILIVDEVLAVGDAEFQKKCIGKMQDVAGHGRTVLLVSHNMAAVQRLCPNSIILKQGYKVAQGATDNIIPIYLEQSREDMAEGTLVRENKQEAPFIEKIEIFNHALEQTSTLLFGEPFKIRLTISSKTEQKVIEPLIAVSTLDDHRIFTAISSDVKKSYAVDANRKLEVTASFDEQLIPGNYKLIFALRSGRNVSHDLLFDALKFDVSEQVFRDCVPNEKVIGFIRPRPKWS